MNNFKITRRSEYRVRNFQDDSLHSKGARYLHQFSFGFQESIELQAELLEELSSEFEIILLLGSAVFPTLAEPGYVAVEVIHLSKQISLEDLGLLFDVCFVVFYETIEGVPLSGKLNQLFDALATPTSQNLVLGLTLLVNGL